MTTLTATPNATHDAVVLSVTGAPPGPVQLSRADVNGLGEVRLPAGYDVTAGGAWNVHDYEAALVGACKYLLRDGAGAALYATLDLAAARPPALLAGDGSPRPQLRRTFRPTHGGPVEWVTGLSARRTLARSEHQVVGRPDVVMTTFGMGLRAGVLTVRCSSLDLAGDVLAAYRDGQVVLLRQGTHVGLDMHHVGTETDVRRVAEGATWYWDVDVTYREVLPAPGDALAGWSLLDVHETFPNLATAALAYATLGDLAADRRGTA